MAYSSTYASLKADILAFTEEDSADFTALLDTIIALGELKVLRELDLEIFQSSGNVAMVVSATKIDLPAGMIRAHAIRYTNGAGKAIFLEKRTLAYVQQYQIDFGANGGPLYFAEFIGSAIGTGVSIAPTPDSAYTANFVGLLRPTGLSGTTATTWLSTNVGDLLLDACLIESEAYLAGTLPFEMWKDRYAERLASAKLEFRGAERATYQMPAPTSRAMNG